MTPAPTPSPVTDEIITRCDEAACQRDGMFRDIFNSWERQDIIRAVLTAALDGMVVVPREPTDAMIDAACSCERGRTVEDALRAEYKAMIASAPKAQGG